jgi:hypothetical protein
MDHTLMREIMEFSRLNEEDKDEEGFERSKMLQSPARSGMQETLLSPVINAIADTFCSSPRYLSKQKILLFWLS